VVQEVRMVKNESGESPTGIVHFPPVEQDRMQGWPMVLSELRPPGNMSCLWPPCRKNPRHTPRMPQSTPLTSLSTWPTTGLCASQLTTLSMSAGRVSAYAAQSSAQMGSGGRDHGRLCHGG